MIANLPPSAPVIKGLIRAIGFSLAFVSCLAHEPTLPLGARCENDEDCRGVGHCRYGRCRAACSFDRDCPAGTACVRSLDGQGPRVCTLPGESRCGASGCPEGLGCGVDQICRNTCDQDRPCEEGRVCIGAICYEEGYARQLGLLPVYGGGRLDGGLGETGVDGALPDSSADRPPLDSAPDTALEGGTPDGGPDSGPGDGGTDSAAEGGAGDGGPDSGPGDGGTDSAAEGGAGDGGPDSGAGDGGTDSAAEGGAGDAAGCSPNSPPWWEVDYAWRRRLTVRLPEGAASLTAGYSVVSRLDTRDAVAAGQMLDTGDDLRVVYRGGGPPMELDRHLMAMDSANTEVWFRTQADIADFDETYFLYYGNPGALDPPAYWADSLGTATDPSRVYLAADDFEEETLDDVPGGWEGSSNYRVVDDGSGNQVLEVNGPSGDGDYLFAGDYSWTDVVVTARQQAVVYDGNVYYGLFTRAERERHFDTLWYGVESSSKLKAYEITMSKASATKLSDSRWQGTYPANPSAGVEWRKLGVRLKGQRADFHYEGGRVGSYDLPAGSMTRGRIGLCAGYSITQARWDDIIVRRYVDPEPEVEDGTEETYCP